MAIIGSVFALLGRFAGKLLNSALSWATVLLFGSVESSKQTVLSLVALGSLLWVVLVIGVLMPDIGTVLIAAVPVPEFVDETVVRLVMLVAALLLPLLIGAAAVYLVKAEQRPKGLGLVTGVLRGYPFTLALALTIAILSVVSLIRKIRSLAKRWESAHVPVVVKPGQYESVLEDLRGVLETAELPVHVKPASPILSLPPRVLEAAAGSGLGGLVPDRLMLLVGEGLEILVYPSDVAISGSKEAVARSRAAIASQLTHAQAYMTISGDAQQIEDQIRAVAERGRDALGGGTPELQEIDAKLARLTVPFDEWETVYRERLQVERDLLVNGGRPAVPGQPTSGRPRTRPRPVEWAAAAIGLGLLALDVALLVAERVAPPRRRTSRG